MRRYVLGWRRAIRAYRMARKKKHGAGKAPRWQAMRIAAGDRFICDGQWCGRQPYYLRGGFLLKIDVNL